MEVAWADAAAATTGKAHTIIIHKSATTANDFKEEQINQLKMIKHAWQLKKR